MISALARPGRHWVRIAAIGSLGVLLGFFNSSMGDTARTLWIQEESSERVPLPSDVYASVKLSGNGDLLFRTSDMWAVHAVRRGSSSMPSVTLHDLKKATAANVHLADDFASDERGFTYFPGMVRESRATPRPAVFVLDPAGRPSPTVRLDPPVQPARIAVAPDGTLLLLGIDPGYIRGNQPACNLVHRYNRSGGRIGSFSPCPAGLDVRAAGPAAPAGPDLRKLRQEVDRGLLWVHGERIYHVMPVSGTLRTFDASGKMLSETVLVPPDAGAVARGYGIQPGTPQVWKVVAIGPDRFLVEWMDAEVSGGGRRQYRFLALHDPAGRALTGASALPWAPCVPAFSDEAGKCYFLRLAGPGRVELVKAAVGVR